MEPQNVVRRQFAVIELGSRRPSSRCVGCERTLTQSLPNVPRPGVVPVRSGTALGRAPRHLISELWTLTCMSRFRVLSVFHLDKAGMCR